MSVCGYCFQEPTDQARIFSSFIATFSQGLIFLSLLEFLAIFIDLEFGLEFTLRILVTGVFDNVNVRYACITMAIYVDQTMHLESGVALANSSSATYS